MDTKPKLKQQNLYENLNERVDEFLKMYKVKKEDMSDEEAIEDKIDANFSVEKTRCKTYHTTPDGERIPMTALYEFMRQLGIYSNFNQCQVTSFCCFFNNNEIASVSGDFFFVTLL